MARLLKFRQSGKILPDLVTVKMNNSETCVEYSNSCPAYFWGVCHNTTAYHLGQFSLNLHLLKRAVKVAHFYVEMNTWDTDNLLPKDSVVTSCHCSFTWIQPQEILYQPVQSPKCNLNLGCLHLHKIYKSKLEVP